MFPQYHFTGKFWIASILILAFSLLLFPANHVLAQQNDVSLHSPYHTIYNHLNYLQEGNFQPDIAALSLNVPEQQEEEAGELAVRLKQILDGQGLYVDMNALPRDPAYTDTVANKQVYTPFSTHPQIYVEKVNDKWLYSRETIDAIPEMYSGIFPFGLDRIVKNLPEFFYTPLFGLEYWQYVGILLLLAMGIVVHKFLSFILGHFLILLIERMGYKDIAHNHIPKVAKPLSIWVLVLFLLAFVPALQLPVSLAAYTLTVLNLLAYVMVIVVLYRMIDLVGIAWEKLSAKQGLESHLGEQLKPMLRKMLKTVVVIIGVLFILQNLEFNITTLLAGLSLGGLAFALAAQDTIKHIFGSVLIFTDKPFKVGDWISFNDMDGTVEEVGLRSTRVRTFHNSLIYIPNGRLADMAVDNYGERKYRRFFTKISITYDTPPVLIEKYLQGLRLITANHPQTRKDLYHIYLNEYNAFSLDILFYIFFEVPDWGAELKAREEVMLSSIRLAQELGVRFAFPTQTLHVEEFPGKEPTTPPYNQNTAELDEKINRFIEGDKK